MSREPAGRPARRTLALGAFLGVLLAATAAVLVLGPGHDRSLADRVAGVASGLRCPSCDGESVAASNAPIARSMRSQVRAQLREGRSEDQVRAWFRDRYGDDVLLSPSASGAGWVLWLVPPVVLVLAGAGLVLTLRRRRAGPGPSPDGVVPSGVCHPDEQVPSAVPVRRLGVAAVAVALVGAGVPLAVTSWGAGPTDVTADPTSASPPASPSASSSGSGGSHNGAGARAWVARARDLDDQGDLEQAALAWRRALDRRPHSAAIRTRLAFDLLRTDHPDQAVPLVRGPARRGGPDRPLALLVLGLAQRDRGRASAPDTLRTFLRVAPEHPAADQVRRLLEEG